MNFQQLIDAVYLETGRPDLVDETAAAVRATLLELHQSGDYRPDSFTSVKVNTAKASPWAIQLSDLSSAQMSPYGVYHNVEINKGQPTAYQGYDVAAAITKSARRIKTVFPAQTDGTLVSNALAHKYPSQLIDSYGFRAENCYTFVGGQLTVYTAYPLDAVVIYGYLNPIVTNDTNFSSWIADELPYLVVFRAAANVLATKIGKDSEANAQLNASKQFLATLYENME